MDKILTLLVLSLGLSACSTILQRSERSGYADDGESRVETIEEYYSEKQKLRFDRAREELGISEGRPLTEGEVAAIRTRVELHRLEQALTHDAEKRQYYSYKPYFRNDAERVYFLSLPNREARERYARQRNLSTEETQFDQATLNLIEANDIGKGMSRNAVRQSWGEPDVIESAGNPIYGNERWVYNKLMSTQDGYKNERRIIYFEAGRVVGWETM